MRDVYLKPPLEPNLDSDKFMKLQKLLFDLADSEDYWGRTNKSHLISTLGMKLCTANPAFFYIHETEKLSDNFVTYVDDIFHAVDSGYIDIRRTFRKKFQCKEPEWDNTYFPRFQIESGKNGIVNHQRRHIENLSTIPNDTKFTTLRSFLAKLAWTQE